MEAHALRTGELDEHAPLLSSQEERPEDIVTAKTIAIRYTAALAFVISVGVAAWWITKGDEHQKNLDKYAVAESQWWLIQFLGWSSASLFVRIHSLWCPASPDFISVFSSAHAYLKYVSH